MRTRMDGVWIVAMGSLLAACGLNSNAPGGSSPDRGGNRSVSPDGSAGSAADGRTAGEVAIARMGAIDVTPAVADDVPLFRNRAGMLFAMVPEPASNLVRVDMRYRTGSTHDPSDSPGLAHLVEHLTFHYRQAPGGQSLLERLDSAALEFNATTSWDETHYFATGFASNLDALIAIETERLRGTCKQVRGQDLTRERSVVRRELESQGSLHSLHGPIRRLAFAPTHPYHRDIGGSPAGVASITMARVCRYVAERYRPENALMVLSGKIDVTAVKRSLERHYGPLIEHDLASSVAFQPPALPSSARTQTLSADVERPALVILAPRPRWGTPERGRYELALSIVVARLRERLRHDQTTLSAGHIDAGGRGSGLSGVFVVARGDSDLGHLTEVTHDLLRNPTVGWDQAPLRKAKAQLRADLDIARDSFDARARSLADVLHYASPHGPAGMSVGIEAVTLADIAAIIRASFAQAITIHVLPRPESHRDNGSQVALGSLPGMDDNRSIPAGGAHRDSRPQRQSTQVVAGNAVHAMPIPALPEPVPELVKRLDNGLLVVLVPRPDAKAVHARLVFQNPEQTGSTQRRDVARLAAWLRQAGERAPLSRAFTDDLARAATMPVDIDADVDGPATIFAGATPANYAPALLWNLHLHVRYGGYHPISNLSKIYLHKQAEALAAQRRHSVEGLLDTVLRGEDADQNALSSLRKTISALTRSELRAHAEQTYRPDRGLLIVVGGFRSERMLSTVISLFGDWRAAPQSPTAATGQPATQTLASLRGQRILLVDDKRRQPRLIVAFPEVVSQADRAIAELAREFLALRLSRRVRHTMTATYHLAVTLRDDALVIDTELGGANAARAVATVLAAGEVAIDDDFRADFVRARRQAVGRLLARSMSTASLMQRTSDVYRKQQRGYSDESLARAMARLTPTSLSAFFGQRVRKEQASVLISAQRAPGTALFTAIGTSAPRILSNDDS